MGALTGFLAILKMPETGFFFTREQLIEESCASQENRIACVDAHKSLGVRGEREVKRFTIGFTKKSAETFFAKLRGSGNRRVADVRLNNVSQLAGFAKRHDFEWFLRERCDVDRVRLPEPAPTQKTPGSPREA